jgi:hypothetical protein
MLAASSLPMLDFIVGVVLFNILQDRIYKKGSQCNLVHIVPTA